MSSLPQISIAVVGAGISGLASAFNLLRSAKRTGKSIRVVLYDKNPSPGGTWSTARRVRNNETRFIAFQ